MKRPIFQSPNFRAGNTPRFVNDDAYDAVAARRAVAGTAPGLVAGSRSRSPSPNRPLSGRIGERVEDLTTRMPIDVTAGEAAVVGTDSKNRTLFEIQHILRGRSAEDLVAIKRILRGTQED